MATRAKMTKNNENVWDSKLCWNNFNDPEARSIVKILRVSDGSLKNLPMRAITNHLPQHAGIRSIRFADMLAVSLINYPIIEESY
jgi:hypothetical protein